MTPPVSPGPEPLYDKPGSIDLAQAMMWVQFATLSCLGVVLGVALWQGFGLVRLEWVFSDIDLGDFKAVLFPAALVTGALLLVALVYGVLTWGLGAGRRWAQVATFVLMPVVIASGVLGTASVSNSAWGLATSVFWIPFPAVTVVTLASGTANQWFRQRGWDPWYRRYYSRRGRAARRSR